jgi:ribA/ribD-fused uncharacterized protein
MTESEITDLETLRRAIAEGLRVQFLFFWGHTSKGDGLGPHVLSQWWPATFEIGDDVYSSAEQYMMAEKARLFGDDAARSAILATSDPRKAKAIGRRVANFEAHIWEENRFSIVVRGNYAKFGQNGALRRYLLETGRRVLVEASPFDSIWGIGLRANDPKAEKPAEWAGLNLLGFALMSVRTALAQED